MDATRHRCLVLTVVIVCLSVVPPALGRSEPLDDAARSATHLLRQTLIARPNAQHHRWVEALQRIGDPSLIPLYQQWAQSDYVSLKTHGLLGLARCDPQRRLDLVRLAAIQEPVLQAHIVSTAMDLDLLPVEQCQQLIDWPDLDIAVKVIVAAKLVQVSAACRPTACYWTPVNRRTWLVVGWRGCCCCSMGHPQALGELRELDASTQANRDQVRQMLLEATLRYEFDQAAPWAAGLAQQQGTRTQLRWLALRTAMRFADPNATAYWQQRFAHADDHADRNRLALIALGLSPWLETGVVRGLDRRPPTH